MIVLSRESITTWAGDAIVNAANPTLLGGGGVDGAIHRAAGPELRAYCQTLPESAPGVRCPTGEARVTPAFGLTAVRSIIHTVGPVYDSPGRSAPVLRACYQNVLRLCRERGIRSVAFPAISCGVYGYPADEAAAIAVNCARLAPDGCRVWFMLPDAAVWRAFCDATEAGT